MPRRRLHAMLLALLLGCSDSTGPTTEGPTFMSALVDHELWSPHPSDVLGSLIPDEAFNIFGSREDSLGNHLDGLRIQVRGFAGLGRYPLSSDFTGSAGFYSRYETADDSVTNFMSDPRSPGEITITALDTVAHRVAGTFSFDALEIGGTQVVHLEQGAFRADYTVFTPQSNLRSFK